MYATGIKAVEGDHIEHTAAGGGGFGDPLERDPALVLEDVADEWMTIETAKRWYGVIVRCIDEDAALYEIDEEETAKLKADMAANREKYFQYGHGHNELNKFTEHVKIAWEPTPEEVQSHITISRPPGW